MKIIKYNGPPLAGQQINRISREGRKEKREENGRNVGIRCPTPHKGQRSTGRPLAAGVGNLFKRVFRVRTATEHDLRVENRGTSEKLLVLRTSANM